MTTRRTGWKRERGWCVGLAMLGAACASPMAQKTAAGVPAHEGRPSKPARAPAQPENTRAMSVRETARAADDRAAVEYQIAMLRKEITLYRQFLERAGDDPQYQEPVQKSRERIEDAENTIAFLLAGLKEPNDGPSTR